ncbi:CLUMA_CG002938, isoform A [Clunio marinus]|uniref:CLUMA_CG002938, isoform A n=1 Tax=Clunio marinus TaxID=568069 RepID=A0A1J1HSK7_9DIPT|nr:CLUMA_CG002938, isoform A [Clunio marinus]
MKLATQNSYKLVNKIKRQTKDFVEQHNGEKKQYLLRHWGLCGGGMIHKCCNLQFSTRDELSNTNL